MFRKNINTLWQLDFVTGAGVVKLAAKQPVALSPSHGVAALFESA